jgi:hypothetical protein
MVILPSYSHLGKMRTAAYVGDLVKAFDSIQGYAKGIWFFYSYPLLMGGFMDKATVRGLRETELWLAEVDTALAWLGLLPQIFGLFHLHIFAVCARQKNTTSTVRHAHNFLPTISPVIFPSIDPSTISLPTIPSISNLSLTYCI